MSEGGNRSNPAGTAVCVAEEVAGPCGLEGNIKGLAGLIHKASGTLEHGKASMPFIEMADFRLDAEAFEQAPAANPKHRFLPQA